jgi:hypothetical protein
MDVSPRLHDLAIFFRQGKRLLKESDNRVRKRCNILVRIYGVPKKIKLNSLICVKQVTVKNWGFVKQFERRSTEE